MIISASRRTDIPAFYSEWFVNRLKAGYVLARNPFNFASISKIPLSPEIVDCIVFWTKDPDNILSQLPLIDKMGYKYYFQFTLTPYDNIIERNLRQKTNIEDTFINLSNNIGKDKVLWRYDPIILNEFIDINYHKSQFMRLCEKLHNYTNSITISFVDQYSKIKTNLIREITTDEIIELSQFMGSTAKCYGLELNTCSEQMDLSKYGIGRSSCIDKKIIEKICSCSLNVKQDKNQRSECGCFESIDIGAYNTCKNGCIYCYANYSEISVKNNTANHNPNGELLIGEVLDGEKITSRVVKSHKNMQLIF